MSIVPVVLFGDIAVYSRTSRIIAAPHLFTYASHLLYQRLILPRQQQQEEEADLVGLLIMQNTGYDVSEAETYR